MSTKTKTKAKSKKETHPTQLTVVRASFRSGLSQLGLILTQLGREQEAQQAFAQAEKLDPRLASPAVAAGGPH
jgi:hypothetical protein